MGDDARGGLAFGDEPGAPGASSGLLPAIVQDQLTGEVRMLAWMDRAAAARTLETGRATFFSRSRQKLWEKGETSGNGLAAFAVQTDCDADAILVLADPAGPTCHTGAPSCFFAGVALVDGQPVVSDGGRVGPLLVELERTIAARKAAAADASYTRSLLDGGAEKIGGKLREESDELARAIASESAERVASEAADVVYHLLVGLALRDVPLRDVLAALAKRRGRSGHDEKASRSPA